MKLVDEHSFKVLSRVEELGTSRFSDLMKEIRNPRTLSRRLKELASMGLLSRSNEGYRLTAKGRRVLNLMRNLLMELSSRDLVKNLDRIPHRMYSSLLRRYCEILREKFGERLVGILLFGSIARGDWKKDSDIDLLLVIRGWKDKKVWERLRELSIAKEILRESREFHETLSNGYFPSIQHYALDPEEVQKFHSIYPDIAADGIILYDKEGFMDRLISSIREKLKRNGALRISTPDGRYYWILKDVRAGEVFELDYELRSS